MKKLRISNSSFEKSLNTFVSKRIFGIGETGENIRTQKGFPVCFHKVRMNDNTELTQMSMWYENTDILIAAQKLLNAYKAKPNWNRSGFEIKSRDNWTTQSEVKMSPVGPDINQKVKMSPVGPDINQKMVTVPSPISRFYLTYTFEGDYLYFKFFARFKNGHKNRKIKQMKINLKPNLTISEEDLRRPMEKQSQFFEPKGIINYCYLLLSNKLTLELVREIFSQLRKIDYEKTTEDDLTNIITICKGFEKEHYHDELISYILFLIDNKELYKEGNVKQIVGSFRNLSNIISHD